MNIQKYRVWDFNDKKMLYYTTLWNHRPPVDENVSTGPGRTANILHKIAVMQYTDFKDRNNKEIWAGDIYYYPDLENYTTKQYEQYGVIAFYRGCFCVDREHNGEPVLLYTHHEDIEIIGNIYENPKIYRGEP